MAKRKASRKAAPKKALRKPARKKPAPKPARKKPAARGAARQAPATPAAPRATPRRRPPGAPPVERIRVVVPMIFYEAHKDEVKAPLKERELKWAYLGEGKGLYKRADGGVHCFTQFKDDGVHYSVWGEDRKARDGILAAWRELLGEEGWARARASGEQAAATEKVQAESESMRLWRLAEPQRRPGEPDLFFQKRLSEWQSRKPA